jgi:hypothetical protein
MSHAISSSLVAFVGGRCVTTPATMGEACKSFRKTAYSFKTAARDLVYVQLATAAIRGQ